MRRLSVDNLLLLKTVYFRRVWPEGKQVMATPWSFAHQRHRNMIWSCAEIQRLD